VIALPDPSRRVLSFMNLIEAHVLSGIRRQHQLQFSAIRGALDYLTAELPSRHPLADRQFETDGRDLFIREYGRILNASQQGQAALREIMGHYLQRIERDPQGVALRLFPYSRPQIEQDRRLIAIDPAVSFGRPVLTGTGIRTLVILDRFIAGDTPEELAEDYGRPRAEIEEAIRWESFRQAA
jgi:uncharacterized protein (DUF433 family)